MNEWASKILSVFPADRVKADLDQFIMEVNNDQAEQMYFHVSILTLFTNRKLMEFLLGAV